MRENLKRVIHPESEVILFVKFKGRGIDSFVESVDPKEQVVARKCSDGMIHSFLRAAVSVALQGAPIRVDYDLLPDDDPSAVHQLG